MLIYTTITSKLDHCNMLYMVLSLNTSQNLQLVQNAVVRFVLRLYHSSARSDGRVACLLLGPIKSAGYYLESSLWPMTLIENSVSQITLMHQLHSPARFFCFFLDCLYANKLDHGRY